MSESNEPGNTTDAEHTSPSALAPQRTGYDRAGAPPRQIVGVVRVLRGRLAAPCRCCSDATSIPEKF